MNNLKDVSLVKSSVLGTLVCVVLTKHQNASGVKSLTENDVDNRKISSKKRCSDVLEMS